MEGFTFLATLTGARLLVDGGWRITLDLDQSQMASLIELAKHKDNVLQCALVPVPQEAY